MLSRFVHTDAVYRIRNESGQPLTELVDMVVQAEQLPPGGRTRREYYRHIGDFALFWTGVFPETLNRTHGRHRKDHLVDYTVQGKRGYLLTSRFDEEHHRDGDAELFRRLSDQFELCAVGLRKVREEWEELQKDVPPGAGLVR